MDAALEAGDSCNCAPSIAERRTFWQKGALTRRNALGIGVIGVAALSAFGVGTGVSAAHAASYPSWDDVQRAKGNQAAKAAEVSRIEGLIQSLTQKVAETQAAAEAAGDEYFEAQQEYFGAIAKAEELQSQADAQAQIAEESARKAGQVAAQLYRNGGDDTALELFFAGSAANADELLSRLGTMDKLLGYNQSVYDQAVAARDSAQLLSDQAVVARTERDRLQKIAEQKMIAAQQAAEAAEAALNEQTENLATLEAQLAALKDSTAKTVADYKEGVRIREARRKAAEEAKRKAAEEAARNNNNGGGGGGVAVAAEEAAAVEAAPLEAAAGCARTADGAVLDTAPVNHSATPTAARRAGTTASTSRPDAAVRSSPHSPEQSTTRAGTAVTATTSAFSTAVESAPDTATSAHSRSAPASGFSAGQVIAYEGNTGGSFGCHLHYEVYINGAYTNPIDFMAARGISV